MKTTITIQEHEYAPVSMKTIMIKMPIIVRASSPQGSTQALAHRERVFALVRLEHARHPAIFLYPLAAALLQIVGLL